MRDAIDWYWTRNPEAALDFAEGVKAALTEVRKDPQLYPKYLHGTRRMLLHRFPYGVIYRERLHDIQIIAVAHAKRRPGYWAKRLKK